MEKFTGDEYLVWRRSAPHLAYFTQPAPQIATPHLSKHYSNAKPQRMQSQKRQQPNTKWWYLESCQRPKIAHVVVAPVGDKKNLYAQVEWERLTE